MLSTSFNRGMQLEAIAALLGHIKHRKMEMTLIYARIANRVIADEYAADGRSRFHCAALSLDARRRASPAAYRAAGKERHHKHWGRGPVPFGFHGAWIPQASAAGRRTIQPHHDHWRRATSPARGLRQAHRSSVLDQLSVAGHRGVQSVPPPVLPAGASPGSAVLPGTMWLPPAARVTFTRRAWALGDAGMVRCRTPSA